MPSNEENRQSDVKFKCHKQRSSVMNKCKNLGNKSQEISNLIFSGRLFVSESMSRENQQLAYKYRQLKSARKIHSTSFLKLTEHGRIYKIFCVTDIENFLEIDNLEEYIHNISF